MATEKRKEQWRRSSMKYSCRNRLEKNAKARAYKLKLVEQRRCTSCTAPLLPDENRTCVNCGSTIKEELKYAADTKRLQQ